MRNKIFPCCGLTSAAERMGGAQGKYKSGAHNIAIVQGGSGGMPPENFEVLHALKHVLGASEAPFCACIQHNTYTGKLPSSFSGFRSKSMLYWALANGLRSFYVR